MEARDERRLLNLRRQLSPFNLLIIDELGLVPLSKTGAELLFEVFSQRYERASILVTTSLPFDERTEVFGSERLTGALLDRLTNHVNILEMNGGSYRLRRSRDSAAFSGPLTPHQALGHRTPAEVFHQAVAAPSEESKTEKGSPKQMLVSSKGATGLSLNSALFPSH